MFGSTKVTPIRKSRPRNWVEAMPRSLAPDTSTEMKLALAAANLAFIANGLGAVDPKVFLKGFDKESLNKIRAHDIHAGESMFAAAIEQANANGKQPAFMLDLREILNLSRAWGEGRNLAVSSRAIETENAIFEAAGTPHQWQPLLKGPFVHENVELVELLDGESLREDQSRTGNQVGEYTGGCRAGLCRVLSARDTDTGARLGTVDVIKNQTSDEQGKTIIKPLAKAMGVHGGNTSPRVAAATVALVAAIKNGSIGADINWPSMSRDEMRSVQFAMADAETQYNETFWAKRMPSLVASGQVQLMPSK